MTPLRFRLLLSALVALSLALPLETRDVQTMLSIFGVAIPLVGGRMGGGRWLAFLAGVSVAVNLLELVGVLPGGGVGVLLSALYFGAAAAVILRQVFQCRCSSLDMLAGAVSCFLLVGLGWTALFGLLEQVQPGSLACPAELDASSLFYFSFVTLLTVGYGDIAPATPLARQLAVMTGLTGMLFSAVVLASLVSLQLARREAERPAKAG